MRINILRYSRRFFLGLMLCNTAQANDHKILGVIAMPRNETNDLALKLPVCRVVKRIQLTADHGDLQLSGASVYFKAARSLLAGERRLAQSILYHQEYIWL